MIFGFKEAKDRLKNICDDFIGYINRLSNEVNEKYAYAGIPDGYLDDVAEKIPALSSEKAIKEYWKSLANKLRKQGFEVEAWNRGSFDDVYDSIAYHYTKHAKEVGATSVQQYLEKAKDFKRNLKRATKHKVGGYVQGVTRYSKNGYYIDLDPNRSIISYGRTGK